MTPDQLMLPACNWSWVTGPYLCTISAADRLHRTCAFPPSLFGCRPGFYLHLHLPSHHLCFVIQAGVGKFSDVLSTLLCSLGPKFLWAFRQTMWASLLASLFSPVKWKQEAPPDLVTETWAVGGCSFYFFSTLLGHFTRSFWRGLWFCLKTFPPPYIAPFLPPISASTTPVIHLLPFPELVPPHSPVLSLGLGHHWALFSAVAAVLVWDLQPQGLGSSPRVVTHWPCDFDTVLTSLSCSISCGKEANRGALSTRGVL